MTKQADKKAETKDVEGQKAAIGQIDRELTKEFVNVVRGLVIHQFAGWTIAGIGALMGFAVIGWWLYFQPWIERTVGGIPSGSVVAFLTECPKQLGWEPFEGVAGRVLIGAGFGTGLTPRNIGDNGGEETHTISREELPKYSLQIFTLAKKINLFVSRVIPSQNNSVIGALTFGTRGDNGPATEAEIEPLGSGLPGNNLPPYLVLNFCKKV